MHTHAHAQRRGVALVLVLAFLVLISVFVVGFFVSASSELTASSGYAATVTTQQLSETATNIVEGQIREASTRPGEVWASQPGMIRTFRTNLPGSFYKLYSSNDMVVEGNAQSDQESRASTYNPYTDKNDLPTGPDAGWNHKPAIFVDLNQPVRVALPGSALGVGGVAGTDFEYRYPILDPAAFYRRGTSDEDGLLQKGTGNFIKNATGATSSKKVEGAEMLLDTGDDSPYDANNPDALQTRFTRMPVRWLYMLKDGTMTAPNKDTGGTKAIWNFDDPAKAAIPTLNNPIVGRIAFWTDDDTCKVNINTAGGFSNFRTLATSTKNEDAYPGSYWDTPRFSTVFDQGILDSATGFADPSNMSLALAQPVRNEFQRYPGHPSTTSLGLVFKDLLTSNQIYAMAPRLNGGGSEGGTKRPIYAKGVGSQGTADNLSLPIKRQRLYASVDELLFAAPQLNDDKSANPRRLNTTELSVTGFTPDLVNRMRFFLTAHSRAPELNVFGRPRISIWPLWPIYGAVGGYQTQQTFSANTTGPLVNRATFRTRVNNNATEKLIAFCSTLGPRDNDSAVRPYFFQRSNPYSATQDGLIPRNVKLFTYLSSLLSQPIVGAGGATGDMPPTFKTKYPGEASATDTGNGDYRQIIAEIFDYIRCVNLVDASHDTPVPAEYNPLTNPAPATASTTTPEYKYSPSGYVVPSVVSGAALGGAPGFGRFPSISEASLVFYLAGFAEKEWNDNNKRYYLGIIKSRKYIRDKYTESFDDTGHLVFTPKDKNSKDRVIGTLMASWLMFEGFCPMEGYAAETSFSDDDALKRGLFFQHECDASLANFQVSFNNMKTDGLLHFPPHDANIYTKNRFWNSPGAVWGGWSLGGQEGFMHTMFRSIANSPGGNVGDDTKPTLANYYPFQSTAPFPPPADGDGKGGYVIDPEDKSGNTLIMTDPAPPGDQIKITKQTQQAISGVYVPISEKTFKIPGLSTSLKISFAGTTVNTLQLNFPATSDDPAAQWPIPTDNIWATDAGGYVREGTMAASDGSNPDKNVGGVYQLPEDTQFTLAGRIGWARRHNETGWKLGSDGPLQFDNHNYTDRRRQLLLPGDTIRSLIPFNPNSTLPEVANKGMGDPRALALIGNTSSVQGKYLQPHPYYNTSRRHAQGIRISGGGAYVSGTARDMDFKDYNVKDATDPVADQPLNIYRTRFGTMFTGAKYAKSSVAADLPPDVTQLNRIDGNVPDFDTGLAGTPDGGFANKSDEGSGSWRWWNALQGVWVYYVPYYGGTEAGYDLLFSPNKQMPSPVQFGSLLAGRTKHWQTLSFSPNAAGFPHPGQKDPKDHYILDLFNMPVVEPYAISEPFSTSGKINLNYAMAPFSYIRRSTAMRAVLHSVRIPAVPLQDSLLYKGVAPDASTGSRNYRFRVNRDETLKAFDSYFYAGTSSRAEIFRTGSQLCEMFLYPNLYTTESANGGARTAKPEMASLGSVEPQFSVGESSIRTFWYGKSRTTNDGAKLTGDNLREKPYNDIYPRITTKSNTYTVHMWVQALRKSSTIGLTKQQADDAQKTWDENKDKVIGEYRGSTSIERYMDPEDRRFDPKNIETAAKQDYLDPDNSSLEGLYRFRVIESKRFAP